LYKNVYAQNQKQEHAAQLVAGVTLTRSTLFRRQKFAQVIKKFPALYGILPARFITGFYHKPNEIISYSPIAYIYSHFNIIFSYTEPKYHSSIQVSCENLSS